MPGAAIDANGGVAALGSAKSMSTGARLVNDWPPEFAAR